VSSEAIRTYTLELDASADPIAGRLCGEAGEDVDFVGWLGLASALEGLLSELEPSDE
jgi:hypothetical protein